MSHRLSTTLAFIIVITIGMGSASINAQSYKVDITMTDYESDSLIIGYYMGERQLVQDTLISKDKKKFTWSGDEPLHNGVYLLLTTPDKNFIQFFINEPYPKFDIKLNGELTDVTFKNSEDNSAFNSYVKFLTEMRALADPIRAKLETAQGEEAEALQDELSVVDEKVKAAQQENLEKYPGSFTAKTIRASLPIDFPDPPADLPIEEYDLYNFENYRDHYFDHVDLSDSTMLFTPFLHNRIIYYTESLTIQRPSELINSIDYILNKIPEGSQMYRYYLSTFYNKYLQSKIIGMDEVVVHLADNYYAQDKAPWTDEDTLEKILDNANKARPSLIGKVAQDIQIELKDGTPIKISDIDYEYLVLLFWAPDCGHCKKAMPDVVAFEEEFRDQNIKLMAVCTKYQDKVPKCWEEVEEKGMQNFINAVDPLGKSRFKAYYDIRTTPKIFILDKDRTIMVKGLGADQLSDVMTEILAKDEIEN